MTLLPSVFKYTNGNWPKCWTDGDIRGIIHLKHAPSPVERGLDVWMVGSFPLEVISILEGDISVTTVVMTWNLVSKFLYVCKAKHNLDSVTCCCMNSSNEWNVQLEGTRRRRTSARATANEEWDSSFALSLCSVRNKVLYTADQRIRHSDTLYSRRAITTRANTMTTMVHSIVASL